MTQPDEYFPSTSVNTAPGFSAYAGTGQSDYESAITGSWVGTTGPFSAMCYLLQQMPFLGGLISLGNPGNNGIGGGLITGAQSFVDSLCGFSGGTGDTTPQTITQGFQATSNSVDNSAMASGIIAIGQADNESGNVVIDAINGAQLFADALWSILTLCGLCNLGGIMGAGPTTDGDLRGSLLAGAGGSFATNVSPWDVLDAAEATAGALNRNVYARRYLGLGGSGNLLVDGIAAGGFALGETNANHVGVQAITPATAVSLKAQNLLTSQDFGAEYTLQVDDDETHWSHDLTVGNLSPGSAKCVCDGTQDALISSETPVMPGENVEIACQVRWDGLSYTGSDPITLGVQKYRKTRTATGGITYSDIGSTVVATIEAPAASSIGAGDNGGDWVGIAGIYVVDANVELIRVRLYAAEAVTGGTVWYDETETLKTDLIADACAPGIGITVDDIVTQLYGTAGSGFSHNESAVALGNTAESLASVSARLAALEAEGHSGAIAGDDFTWMGEIAASANWGGSYSNAGYGNYWSDGVDANWVRAKAGVSQACWFDWQGTDAVSTTDYQLVQLVLNSGCAAQSDAYGAVLHSYIRVYGRMSAGATSSVMAQFGSDNTYSVGFTDAGVYTQMKSGSFPCPGRGAVISFYLGDAGTAAPRHFKVTVGTKIVCEFDEVGTGSRYGVDNRKWGWGALAVGGVLHYRARQLLWYVTRSAAGQGTPATINQWIAMDQ